MWAGRGYFVIIWGDSFPPSFYQVDEQHCCRASEMYVYFLVHASSIEGFLFCLFCFCFFCFQGILSECYRGRMRCVLMQKSPLHLGVVWLIQFLGQISFSLSSLSLFTVVAKFLYYCTLLITLFSYTVQFSVFFSLRMYALM